MEEDQAHAYYVDLKTKGSGAAMFKEGLGFDKGGPGSTNQGHIQFVAQKQDSHLSGQAPDAESKQVLSGDSHPWQSATLGQPQQQQMPRAQQPPPQGLMQQQAPRWDPNGISQQSSQPPTAGSQQPVPGPGSASHAGMGPAAPHIGRGLPPGMHARPPPGMRPSGIMQGFPGAGPPPGFPPQRPPMATPPRPPQGWGQPQQGSPRPPQMMPHPMHHPPPQHPGGGSQQIHLLRPPPNQQGSHLRTMPPQHPIPQQLLPQQLQQHLQSSGNMLSARPGQMASPGPQAMAQARPTVPMQLNGMPAGPVTQAAPLQQLGARSQPAMATHKPTTGGWMAHKSEDGQVYYHNTSTEESSWQKPEGFEGNAAAGKGTPTPASSEGIPLTGWSEVTCTDGRKYYYHAERQETSWSKPPEVAVALAKAIKAGASKKAGMTADQVAIIARLKANNAQLNLRPELQEAEEPEEEDNDDVTFTDQDIGQPEAVTHAQSPQNPPLPTSLPPMPGGPPRPMQFPGAYSPQSAMQVPPLPAARSHDALVQDFKDLLLESKVTPFSRWERELPKLVGDSRYKAIDKPKERRQIFDDFCRNVAEEQSRSKERKEKQAAAAEAAFLALLDEAQAWSEEDQEAAEPGSSNTAIVDDEDAAEKPYNDLRVIRRALTAATQTDQMEAAWGHDPRWQGIDSKLRERLLVGRIDQLQADVKQVEEATKAAQEQAFRVLLKETKVSSSSRYSKVREDMRSDERYRAMSSSHREAAFKLYQADLKAMLLGRRDASTLNFKEGEEVVRKQEQETLDRDAAAKKAEADAKRRQREAAHNDAVAAFQTLLAETVKDSSARWQDWKTKLGKDPQGRADNKAFAPREQQSLFEKYVKELGFQIEQDFRNLMDQMLRPMLPPEAQAKTRPAPLATFEAASTLLETDLRWDRVAERDRERLWRGYVRDIVHERDHPQQHNRLAASSRAAERDKGRSAKDVGDVVDKAYLREYIEPDQKRARRDL
ncbi:hypothetical protein WJX77_001554 [Trebouxia sp. C0004]